MCLKVLAAKITTIRVQVALPSNKSGAFFALDSVATIAAKLSVTTSFKGTSKIVVDMQQLEVLKTKFASAQLGLQINASLNRSWMQQLASNTQAGFLVFGRSAMILQAINFSPDHNSRSFDPAFARRALS